MCRGGGGGYTGVKGGLGQSGQACSTGRSDTFHAALAWRVQKKALEWSSSVHREPIRLRPNTSLSMSRKTATDRRALRPTTASLSRLTTRGDGGNAERATTAFRQRRQAEAEYHRMKALLSKIGLLYASYVLSASLRRVSKCLVVSG